MQILTIAGNVGRDAELRKTQNGDSVLGFSIAVDNGKDKDASWYDCSVWGKRADALSQHITKGLKLCVSGRPSCREHNGKAYMQINVDQLTFQGGGQQSGQQRGYDQSPAGDGYGAGGRPSNDIDDVIPF